MARLHAMDDADTDPDSLQPPPRATYCCDARYRLPGGSRILTLDLEDIWEHVAPLCSVRVSGVLEGVPENVLSNAPDAWFETDDTPEPMPWIQVELPTNVKVVSFNKYMFSHGHRRSGYYRMRNWQTMTSLHADGAFTRVIARPSVNEPFEVIVTKPSQDAPWRAIKLVGTDRQEDAVFRLCVRNLRIFGKVEVDLLQQGAPNALVLTSYLVNKIKARQAAAAAGSGSRRGSASGSGDVMPLLTAAQFN
eukprot:GHUV01015604.1.p1 GENE.GHUV01015604.1~~GHUV01015604.1.p1  ORF type:complete len:249 (+),score=56.25 GHUV01015604.1:464-1210(+)